MLHRTLPAALCAAAALVPAVSAQAVQALHKSGQTFVTWDEDPGVVGERYRVYRADVPILSASGQSVLLVDVPEGSGEFHADRRQDFDTSQWSARRFERYVIHPDGDELPPGTGLCVWTLDEDDLGGATSGEGWYAVVRVVGGQESVVGAVGPVAETVDDPAPVRAVAGDDATASVFIQYLDLRAFNATFHAPNPVMGTYGLDPAAPEVQGALQYAFPYELAPPDPNVWSPDGSLLPLVVNLHGHHDDTLPANDGPASYGLPAWELRPLDVHDTWWFGFARDHDYRTGALPGAGDAIGNQTEARVLRMVHDALRSPGLGAQLDPQRVYAIGASMGGTGAMSFAMRYPDVFAAAYASVPMTDFQQSGTGGGKDWKPDVALKWGDAALDLPVDLDAPSDWGSHQAPYQGTGVWTWMDHQHNLVVRAADEMAPFGLAHGTLDLIVEWSSQGAPIYPALRDTRVAGGGAAYPVDHVWTSFLGLPPALEVDAAGVPFHGLRAIRDETMPAITDPADPPFLPAVAQDAWSAAIEWSASWNAWHDAPVDLPLRWAVSLRTVDSTSRTVHVTPRRAQAFAPVPGELYRWEARSVATGQKLAAGLSKADPDGLLTARGVEVDFVGVRLAFEPYDPDAGQATFP